MGISAGGAKGGVKSDINVTPLVDIVLVLLIIFLVVTPIMLRHVTVEVPRKLDSDTEVSVEASSHIVVVTRANGTIEITQGAKKDTADNVFELAKVIRPILDKKRTEKVVFVDFDDRVPYSDAVTVMDTIKGAGAEKVAIKLREDDQQNAPSP